MGRSTKDIRDKRYGLLTVMHLTHDRNKHGQALWRCVCDCGNEKLVTLGNLTSGNTKSCGCLPVGRKKKPPTGYKKTRPHGPPITIHPLYQILHGMTQRCGNPNSPVFRLYGARGISVCDEWKGDDGIRCFLRDMGGEWSPGMTIERIDNDLGYCKSNCRWVPANVQQMNRRCDKDIVVIHPDGTEEIVVGGHISAFCREHGLDIRRINDILVERSYAKTTKGYRARYLEHKLPSWLRPQADSNNL